MKTGRFFLFRVFITILTVFGFSLSFNLASAHQTGTPHSHYGPRLGLGVENGNLYRAVDNNQYRFPLGIDTSNESGFFRVIVDPAFEAKFKKDRLITSDLPLTPIYDLIVQIRPTWGSAYASQEYTSGLPTEPPTELKDFKGYITVGDDKILGPGTFKKGGKLTDRNYTEFDVYEWKISGNDLKGIVGSGKMEQLISAIQNAGQPGIPEVKVSVEFPDIYSGPQAPEGGDPGFSLCAPLWGSGQNKVIGMRASPVSASDVVTKMEDFRDVLRYSDPFARYRELFSYSADLMAHNEDSWDTKKMKIVDAPVFLKGVAMNVTSISSCPGDFHDTHIFLSKKITRSYALPSVHTIFLDSNSNGTVILHEFGHTFADLRDEYPYSETPNLDNSVWYLRLLGRIIGKNCSINPVADFKYNGSLYGSTTIIGCGFTQIGLGSTKSVIFRPSSTSIMKSHKVGSLFNVVSCGYIISAIKGGNAKSYFQKCMGLDTIKSGIASIPTDPIRFSELSNDSLTAQAGGALDAVSESNIDSEDVIFEDNFAPDGTITGNMYFNDGTGKYIPVASESLLVPVSSQTSSTIILSAQSLSTGSLTLTWTSDTLPVGNVFEIERAKIENFGVVYNKIAQVAENIKTYTDLNILPAPSTDAPLNYNYRVRAKLLDGTYTPYSNIVNMTITNNSTIINISTTQSEVSVPASVTAITKKINAPNLTPAQKKSLLLVILDAIKGMSIDIANMVLSILGLQQIPHLNSDSEPLPPSYDSTVPDLTVPASTQNVIINNTKKTLPIGNPRVNNVNVFPPSLPPLPVKVISKCSSPANHLSPCLPGNPSEIISSPSKWTWICNGSGGQFESCSENKTPGYIEN